MSRSNLFKILVPKVSIFYLLFIGACGCNDSSPLEKVKITEDALQVQVKSRSFDLDLFACDFASGSRCSDSLRKEYGTFFCSFIEEDLMLAACQSDSVNRLIQTFIHDAQIAETHRAVMSVYTLEKRNELDEAFTDVVQRWNHYFPSKPIPEIIYYCSAWNRSIATTDSIIGIALDCYLGANHSITQKLAPDFFPAYMKENMDERYIIADAVKGFSAWNARNFYQPKDLLSELIFYGKVMYVAEALAPSLPDSTLMSWNTQQWEWAIAGEEQVWKTLANEKTMYHSRPFEINKWFADGPFTSATGIPQQSAPQLGVWMGWNIVRSYMKKNPETTMDALIAETDNQRLLSAYVPGKR
jgi:hypothetical protein